MDSQLINYCMVILFITIIKAQDISANEEQRQARKSNHRVYSGSRPQPIHCTNEGLQADPHDCAAFYRCVKGGNKKYSVYRFQCAPGTVYDPDIEACNHARDTKRSECGGLIKPLDQSNSNEIDDEIAEYPSPITTIKPIYTEKPDISTPTSVSTTRASTTQSTPSQTTTKAITTSTVRASVITTAPSPISATNSLITSNEIYYSPFANAYETTTKRISRRPTTPDTRLPTLKKDICTSDGFMGDSENCHKFYRCVGNQRGSFMQYEFSCSEPTIWDEELQSCNHPWAVKRTRCGRSNSNIYNKLDANIKVLTNTSDIFVDKNPLNENSIKDSDAALQDNSFVNYGSDFTQSQTQKTETVSRKNQTHVNYGHVMTNYTSPEVITSTQVNYNYNYTVSQTTTQSSIDNSIQNYHSEMKNNITVLESTAPLKNNQQDYFSKEQISSTTKSISDNNNNCRESGFMRDQNDCKKFYRCVDNGRGGYSRYEYYCGEGTLWDSSIESCNHAWAVKDCNNISGILSTTSIESTLEMNQPFQSTSIKVPTVDGNKSSEVFSYGITQVHSTTRLPSTNQDMTTKNVISTSTNDRLSTESTVSLTNNIAETNAAESLYEVECLSDGFVGDKNDCKIFYRCIDNGNGKYSKIPFECGDGTVWDSEIGACNHRWAVKKCGGVTVSEVDKTESTSKTTTLLLSTTLNPSTVLSSSTNSEDTDNVVDYESGYGGSSKEPIYSSTMLTSKDPAKNNLSSSNDCKNSGFMSDINDCKIFYRCIDNGNGKYSKIPFECGDGTVWDSEIGACNHRWAVKKCGGVAVSEVDKIESTSKTTTLLLSTTLNPSTVLSSSTHSEETDNVVDYESAYDGSSKEPIYSSTMLTSKEPAKNNLSSSNNCKNSGFMSDKNDCKKFYRCVDDGNGSYIRFEFTCGQGTVWDEEIEACNHAWAVKQCSNGGTNTDVGSSTQNYILTTSASETITHYTTEKITTSHTITTSKASTYSTTNAVDTNTDYTPLNSQAVCQMEGFQGDPKDCKKFYRCVDDGKAGFIKYDFTCGGGTFWNDEMKACDHEYNSHKCSQHVGISTTEKTISTVSVTGASITSSLPQEEKTTQATQIVISSEPSTFKCSSDGFFANPNDCKKFVRCVANGKDDYSKYDFTCGDGTVWVQEIQACDHDDRSEMCKTQINSTETAGIASSSEKPQYTSSATMTTSLQVSIQQGDEYHTEKETLPSTNDLCIEEGFYGSKHNCNLFYRCVDNGHNGFTKYEFMCGEGTAWDDNIQACNHITEVSRCHSSNQSGSETPPIYHENDGLQQTTPDISSTTTTTTQKLNLPDSTESSTTISGNICQSEGYFGDTHDCKRFYRCVNDGKEGFTKYEFMCGEGTAWDYNIQACNHISEVSRCHSSNQTGTETPPIYDENDGLQQTKPDISSTTTTTTTQKSNLPDSTESSTTISGNICQSEGYFGDTHDCKRFYRCVNDGKGGFMKYDYTCGDGTIWDQDIATCNHPHDVTNPTCKENQENIQSSSSSSTTNYSNTTESTTVSNQDSCNCSQNGSSSNPQSNNVTCEKAGYYPDLNDCKKFYRCVDWDGDGTRFSVFHFTCGEGTIWDPVVETCNHEQSVYPPRDCSGTQSHTEINQENTSTQQSPTSHTSTEPNTSSTSEHTTTDSTTTGQQTTTTEQTTSTQQSTASPCTTQKPTTSKQTTKHYTTTEQTTTPITATSEVTTQSSTTSEKTTQGTSSSEQTSTEKTSTSEQTTQESITSEQTTTEKTTTSEQTTTQKTTTSEQTTTQKTTTSEQTTLESTTSEQTSQQSTSSEQTTTTQPTSEQTTQSESNSESTTSSFTTEQQTTSEHTTLASTDESITTEESTDSTTTEQVQTTTGETTSENQECPETENDQYLFVCPTSFRRHHKYCNMFYQCTEDDDSHDVKIAIFTCPNNTVYDETKVQCVDEKKADKKCSGEMARMGRYKRQGKFTRQPITVGKYSQTCPTVGHYSFERDVECSPAFLSCGKSKTGKLQGYIHQCPPGYVYWSISRRCEKKQNVPDCRQSRNDWSNRWEIPIDSSNIAI